MELLGAIGETVRCVSLVLALTVLAVYASLPALRNLHGTLLICYLATYIALSSILIYWYFFDVPVQFEIYFWSVYFLELSVVTWPTIIAFDIWLTFRRPCRQPRGPRRRRLLVYCLVGLVYFLSVELSEMGICKFTFDVELRGVINSHCLLNTLLFLFTLYNIHTARYRSPDVSYGAVARQALLLSARLALLMGLDLVAVLASNLGDTNAMGTVIGWIFRVKGVSLFVLLVCNARVLGLIRERWSPPPPVVAVGLVSNNNPL